MTYQRDFDHRLRIGLVGVGNHAYRNILPALHYLPVELVALCDVDTALLERTTREYGSAARFTDASRMYQEANLDAVLLCAGPRVHARLAMEALRANLHVWMEKPPAMRARDVQQIIDVQGDRVCSVGFKKAHMPATRKVRDLIANPEFGAVRSILAVYPMSIPRQGQAILDGGQFHNWLANGCHPLSFMLAVGGHVHEVSTLRGPGDEAVGTVFLQFASGAVGNFHLAAGAPAGQPIERYDIFGDGKVISIENSARISYRRGIPFDYQHQVDFTGPVESTGTVFWETNHSLATLENKALFVQGIHNELMDFCESVLSGSSSTVTDLAFALEVMQVYEAALVSDGKPVKLS